MLLNSNDTFDSSGVNYNVEITDLDEKYITVRILFTNSFIRCRYFCIREAKDLKI